MSGVQLNDSALDLLVMLVVNETIDQLAMANSVHWHGHGLRQQDDHVLRRALDLQVEERREGQ